MLITLCIVGILAIITFGVWLMFRCHTCGHGWMKQSGNFLVCQKCGDRIFTSGISG